MIRNTRSPLTYDRSSLVYRIELVDESAPPPARHDTYFAESQRQIRTSPTTGRVYKKPRIEVVPGAGSGVVGFLDWHELRPDGFYIDYMKVRADLQGRGLMRRLVKAFYETIVIPSGGKVVLWGRIMNEQAWKIFKSAEADYPSVVSSGHSYF